MTHANNFFKIVVARHVVPEQRIIWDDLSVADAICSHNLVEKYKLQRSIFSEFILFYARPRMRPLKLVHVCSVLNFPRSPSYLSVISLGCSKNVVAQMAAVYAVKGKSVASDAGVNLYSPILMAKHICFTYSDDVDEAVSSTEEDPEENLSKEIVTTGSPLYSTGSSQSDEF
ncbi:hypothetical protein C1H46_005740 [Malus baccata]|uniref:Uncharacterized protein n=1 Tax=Malus baccata TaxID=106549 RepID=A0A540NC83_MALBA|nr:hypothetical protein C1H46_005740 [Malus baccata]